MVVMPAPGWKWQTALTWSSVAVWPASASVFESAIAKQAACAAAISSSGEVLESGRSVRAFHVTGCARERPAVDADRPLTRQQVAVPDRACP